MAARLEGPIDAVSVAGANAEAFHFHVPVVAGALVHVDDLLGFAGGAIGEDQQLDAGGLGSHHGEVDAPLGERGPQWPGVSDPGRRQINGQRLR